MEVSNLILISVLLFIMGLGYLFSIMRKQKKINFKEFLEDEGIDLQTYWYKFEPKIRMLEIYGLENKKDIANRRPDLWVSLFIKINPDLWDVIDRNKLEIKWVNLLLFKDKKQKVVFGL